MFGKVMSIPDALMGNYFTLLTDMPTAQIAELTNAAKTHPRAAKETLGKKIVSQFHGEAAGEAAAAEFARVFTQKQMPSEMQEIPFEPLREKYGQQPAHLQEQAPKQETRTSTPYAIEGPKSPGMTHLESASSEIQVPAPSTPEGPQSFKVSIVDLMNFAEFASSKSDARRRIEAKSVYYNGIRITDVNHIVSPHEGDVLRVGKLQFGRIVFS